MKFILLLIVLYPFIGNAQGIVWAECQNWEQVLKKAKEENKYIFVDCYASWCGPCKLMDKKTYPNDTVGNYLNNNFISVKIQFDTTKNDGAIIKSWYKDANKMQSLYNVTAYPTFLFFSPDGEIIHEDAGYKNVQKFVNVAMDALDPKKQYFSLLRKYDQGHKDYTIMPDLAISATRFKNQLIANKIAKDYIDNVLVKERKKFLSIKNIQFVATFAKSSNEAGFWLIFNNADTINKIMNSAGYAEGIIINVISREEIDPTIIKVSKVNAAPDWKRLSVAIEKKYNNYYSNRCILEAKIRWYGYKEDWVEYCRNIKLLVKEFGHKLSNWEINGYAWQIVQHSSNKEEIENACEWMKKVVATESDSANLLPASFDTYASLLYKAGYKKEAINMEEKALNLAITHNVKNFIKDYQITLDKMRQNENIFNL